MVNTRQQRNRTPISPNREIEGIRDGGNHRYNHANSSSVRTRESETGTTIPEGRLDRMERVIENLLNYTTRGEPAKNADNVLEQYRRQRPPIFKGKPNDDPSMAEYWLEQTEKLLRHLQYNDEEKLNCATFMLEEEAGRWWQTAKRALQRSHSRQGSEIDETPTTG